MMRLLFSIGLGFVMVAAALTCVRAADSNSSDRKIEIRRIQHKSEEQKWVAEGNRALGDSRFDEAIRLYKKAIAANPRSVGAQYDLGIAYARKGMVDDAIAAYQKVISIDANHAQAFNNLGIAYEKKSQYDKSLSAYREAVLKNENLAPAQYNLGRAYLRAGKPEQAAGPLYKAGVLFLKQGNKTWASNAYTALQQTNDEQSKKALYEKLHPETHHEKGTPAP